MILWKGLPSYPNPCWPVASSRKLRAVLGTLLSNSWKTIRPAGFESIAMSNFKQFDMIRFARKKNNRFLLALTNTLDLEDKDEVLLLMSIVAAHRHLWEWSTSIYQPRRRSRNDASLKNWPFFLQDRWWCKEDVTCHTSHVTLTYTTILSSEYYPFFFSSWGLMNVRVISVS